MRKFLPYIVILIILAGLFSSATPVNAGMCTGAGPNQTGVEVIGTTTIEGRCLGVCTYPNTPTWEFRTNDECLGGGGTWNWNQASASPAPPQTLPGTNTPQADTKTTYTLLAPLPGLDTTIDTQKSDDNPCVFGKYMNSVISLIIGLIAIGAVVMIVLGGLQYMTSDLISSKEAGKDRIRNALLGLLIALGAYTLLFTINQKLVDMCLDLPEVKIVITEGREIEGTTAVCGKNIVVNGQTLTSCNENEIVTMNFLGKQIRVNRAIAPDLQAIDTAWNAMPEATRYQINTIGGYNPRGAIGSPSNPSSHAFGVGLDINPSTNPYSDSLTPCTTDMPISFIRLFTSRGFGWGGYWVTKKDTMHFSKQSSEAKYLTGTCAGLTQ